VNLDSTVDRFVVQYSWTTLGSNAFVAFSAATSPSGRGGISRVRVIESANKVTLSR